jgi:adenylate cyclase
MMRVATADKQAYEFGEFRYDCEQRVLLRGGRRVALEPKVLDVLDILVKNEGRIVSKDELLKAVWPDVTVEDVGLARNISLLRKALDEDGSSGQYIETVPRRGYRFVGNGGKASESVANGRGDFKAGAGVKRRRILWIISAVVVVWVVAGVVYWQFYRPSRFVPRGTGYANIAVVPFTCLSPEIDCGKFSKGFTDLAVAELSKAEKVHVISPSTVERYQRARISPAWMARILGLQVLLEGTVQKLDEPIRRTARLGDVHSGRVIWSESYDSPASDLDRAEGEAAVGIAREVAARLK